MPSGLVGQLALGLGYPLRGVAEILRGRLWIWAAAAVAVNVVGVGVYVASPALASLTSGLGAWLAPTSAVLRWAVELVSWLVWALALVLVFGAAALLVVLVGQAVASPFLDLLSEQIETQVLGSTPAPLTLRRLGQVARFGLADLLFGLFFYVCVQAPLFVLGLLPVVGTGPAAVASFIFGSLFLAHEFIGLSLVRRLASYGVRWRVVRQNLWVSLGFGAATMALLFVPGLNLVFLPVAAAGGTLLYCDLVRWGRLTAGELGEG
jgi:CysZ protein